MANPITIDPERIAKPIHYQLAAIVGRINKSKAAAAEQKQQPNKPA